MNAQETPGAPWQSPHRAVRCPVWVAGGVWHVTQSVRAGCVNVHATPADRWHVSQPLVRTPVWVGAGA